MRLEGGVEMTAFSFVAEEVAKGRSILGLHPPTDPQATADYGLAQGQGR